jgi:GNAT superfamily N-acetyltransferase
MPTAMFNRVIGAGVFEPAREEDVDHWIARFAAAGGRPWWLHVSPYAAPAALVQWLADRGFAAPARRSWAKVWRPASAPPSIATGLCVAPMTDAALPEAVRCIVEAFEMPPFMADWLAALHGRPGWRLYSVADAGRPVGAGALYVDGRVAWLGMGAVLATHRRRGGQGALMAHRIAAAADAGCEHVITETGEPIGGEVNPSLANMFRCGFRRVASRLNLQAP